MNTIKLLPGETVEDLQLRGLQIIRPEKGFWYGTDAVLLADFARVKNNQQVCDLGAGGGILSFLLFGRAIGLHIDALEMDRSMADSMHRSIQLNALSAHMSIQCGDLRRIDTYMQKAAYDLVICNPPYHEREAAQGMDSRESAARTEQGCTFLEVAGAASFLLRNRGRFVTMCPISRLFELSYAMQQHHLQIKRLRLVRSAPSKAPYLCLLEGMKGAKPGLLLEEMLTVADETGAYTEEVQRMYHSHQGEEP